MYDEIDFWSIEEAEGSRRRKEFKSAEYEGHEANKGEKLKTKIWSNVAELNIGRIGYGSREPDRFRPIG